MKGVVLTHLSQVVMIKGHLYDSMFDHFQNGGWLF